MIGIAAHCRNHGDGTPDEVLSFIHKLEYRYIDIDSGIFPCEDAVASPAKAIERSKALLEKYELIPSEYLPGGLVIDSKSYRPVELSGESLDKACLYFDKICSYAKKVGFTSVKGVSGDYFNDIGFERSVERTVTSMTKLAQVAVDNGLAYNVEPSKHSRMFDTPQKAYDMARMIKNLTYTLDLLHYQESGYTTNECLSLLLEYTNHVHARQTATGWDKCPFEFGEIDYDMMIKRMRGMRWSGVITIEWWLSETQKLAKMSAIDQGIVMRYELKKLIKKYYADLLIP